MPGVHLWLPAPGCRADQVYLRSVLIKGQRLVGELNGRKMKWGKKAFSLCHDSFNPIKIIIWSLLYLHVSLEMNSKCTAIIYWQFQGLTALWLIFKYGSNTLQTWTSAAPEGGGTALLFSFLTNLRSWSSKLRRTKENVKKKKKHLHHLDIVIFNN